MNNVFLREFYIEEEIEKKKYKCILCNEQTNIRVKAKYKKGIKLEPLCEYHNQVNEQIRRDK